VAFLSSGEGAVDEADGYVAEKRNITTEDTMMDLVRDRF
jgi:hypothetical protein